MIEGIQVMEFPETIHDRLNFLHEEGYSAEVVHDRMHTNADFQIG